VGLSGGPGDEGILWVRELTVRVRLWGTDHVATEAMLDDFVNVVDRQLGRPGYRLATESWSTGGVDSLGVVVELGLVLNVALPRRNRATRTLEQIVASYRLNETAV
jgi:hypothetical protein